MTGEKKKSKSKLVSILMAKERAFYVVLYTVLIFNRVWALAWGHKILGHWVGTLEPGHLGTLSILRVCSSYKW